MDGEIARAGLGGLEVGVAAARRNTSPRVVPPTAFQQVEGLTGEVAGTTSHNFHGSGHSSSMSVSVLPAGVETSDMDPQNLRKYPTNDCNRCHKPFAQLGPKAFKMCAHCRLLQRQRSKRWQDKTKSKEGVCRRCGTPQAPGAKFVLCLHCRDILRRTKASRVHQGRCVHCSGPNLEGGSYKVCRRCRDRDKLRRVHLEHAGSCSRCGGALGEGGHKQCAGCRGRKALQHAVHAEHAQNVQQAEHAQHAQHALHAVHAIGRTHSSPRAHAPHAPVDGLPLLDSTTDGLIFELEGHAQLNRQLSQMSHMSQFDIDNLMRYDSEGNESDSEMVAAVDAAVDAAFDISGELSRGL